MKKVAVPSAVLIVLVLSACGRTDSTYPSLALRPAEAKGFAEPDAPPPAPLAADPALDAQVAQGRRSLAAIVSGFDRDLATARSAAGQRGARTAGSDSWLDAQTALARLDDWRAQASSVATDADALASARAAVLQPASPAVEALRTAAAAEVERQDAAIRQLATVLPGA